MQFEIFKRNSCSRHWGLGIFMLGLEFMSDGINNLAANRMRVLLAKIAGTPVKGLCAGTLITGVLQSSTAMTVMVVGLVNAGVIGLRPAISIIMGANIGTTLGNGLIALPLGPLGLILGGLFALVFVFSKVEKTKNTAMAFMGFALIFYGLNLLTGGLKPLRTMPEVMSAISALNADSFTGLISCVFTAAGITALIHSSSATIGIVMGLGAAYARLADSGGILAWRRPGHHHHLVDGVAEPVQKCQASRLCTHLVQLHRRCADVAAVLHFYGVVAVDHGLLWRRSRQGSD